MGRRCDVRENMNWTASRAVEHCEEKGRRSGGGSDHPRRLAARQRSRIGEGVGGARAQRPNNHQRGDQVNVRRDPDEFTLQQDVRYRPPELVLGRGERETQYKYGRHNCQRPLAISPAQPQDHRVRPF